MGSKRDENLASAAIHKQERRGERLQLEVQDRSGFIKHFLQNRLQHCTRYSSKRWSRKCNH